ncbi:MAG: hypothetical protein KGH75_00980 [Rhodospirillales bacterium]|nr:hypothetical protein [Rhodospirillales bacterium]
MTICARLACWSVIEMPEGGERKSYELIGLRAVYSSDPSSPNYSFSQATPCADFSMTITNPAAFGAFLKGKEYDVLLSPVDREPG